MTLQPGSVYSLTTTTGQGRGDAAPAAAAPFPFPYADDFQNYALGRMPKYFSDMYGSFEIVPAGGGRPGKALRQMAPAKPISWKNTASRPFTMIGDLAWKDYKVSCDVLEETPGSVDIIARLGKLDDRDTGKSYVLRVSDSGEWAIIKAASKGRETKLASGTAPALGNNEWHNLALTCDGGTLTAQIDNATVGTASDSSVQHGMAGLGVVGYRAAQFANFKIEPAGPGPAR